MSNLSDLLPAGAGAKSATFTADGTLSSGQTVVLQSDGTVTAVAESGPSAGSESVFESADSSYCSAAFDSNSNKVVISYQDAGNSNYGTAVVGTVSGTSITFGTPVVFESANAYEQSMTFDSNSNKVVICYADAGNGSYGTAIVGTVSGTSISFGSAAVFESAVISVPVITFDSNSNKVAIAYRDSGNSNYGTAVVGTVSGTSISFGSATVFESASTNHTAITFDSNSNKVVVVYRDNGNSGYGTAIVGTVSSTSISFGSATAFYSGSSSYHSATFDSNSNKVVITFRNLFGTGNAIVGTVSSTSISFGSSVEYDSSSVSESSATFDSSNNKVVVAYDDNSAAGAGIVGTVSGTSISFGSPVTFNTSYSQWMTSAFDSNSNSTVIAYKDTGNSNYGTAVVFQTVTKNVSDFVGITDEAIADTATGSVVVEGGQITNTGLLPPTFSTPFGTPVVYEAASVNTSGITFDSSNNKIVIAYRDGGNSNYGTAIVGTVSGTSISYGTPVVFATADTEVINCTFDTSNNKVVIAFKDSGNSSYGTAIVGTVSGTSISFGTEVVFNSANTAYMGITFDSNANKAVISYTNLGTSPWAGTGIVGTVSGTSISFGSASTFGTADSSGGYDVTFPKIAFDSTANKVVIIYKGLNAYTRGVVGTVSGTSISFGTDQTVDTNTGPTSQNIVYDSNADRSVFIFVASDGTGKAYAASLSGTTLTFGDQLTWESSATAAEVGACYDSNINRTILIYRDGSNSNAGTSIPLAVSGLTVTAETKTVFTTNRADASVAAFDSNLNKVVVSYRDFDNSGYGTSAVGTPASAAVNLTIGSTYYVQDDGTLSTTSSSVTAGKAIATDKLLLKG